MMSAVISLTSGMRSSLLSMQGIAKTIDRTQDRLTTGLKVNSALDNPTNFFASQAHLNRASDLLERKDSVKEAIQNVAAASNGITAITSLLEAANGITSAALGTSDQTLRSTLASQFNEVLSQIDSIASDSSYRGSNLLNNESLTVNFSESSSKSTLDITGVNATSSGLAVAKTGIVVSGPAPQNPNFNSITTPLSGTGTGLGGSWEVGESFHTSETLTMDQCYKITDFLPYPAPQIHYYRLVSSSGGVALGIDRHNSNTGLNYLAGVTVKSGSFSPGTSITVEYYPGGIDESTGVPIGTQALGSWATTAGIQTSLDELKIASDSMRTSAKQLAGNSTILTTRLDFIDSLSSILQTGSDKLTLADMIEEGANMLMLQTRQNLGTTSLSLSAQATQSVLRIF